MKQSTYTIIVILLLIIAASMLLPIHTITPTKQIGLVYRQNRITGYITMLGLTDSIIEQK